MSEFKYIDIQPLKSFQEMGAAGKALLDELVSIFHETSQENLTKIQEGLEIQNCEMIWQAAHSLKSSSAALGALRLSDLAKTVEKLGIDGKIEDIKEEAPKVSDLLRLSLLDLKEFLVLHN